MRVSAKADYAIRAAVELAAAGEGPIKGDRIAQAQEIPSNFLENILVGPPERRHRREPPRRGRRLLAGASGGGGRALRTSSVLWTARWPTSAVFVRSRSSTRAVQRSSATSGSPSVPRLRSVLEHVTIADLARGELPESVRALAADPDAWAPH